MQMAANPRQVWQGPLPQTQERQWRTTDGRLRLSWLLQLPPVFGAHDVHVGSSARRYSPMEKAALTLPITRRSGCSRHPYCPWRSGSIPLIPTLSKCMAFGYWPTWTTVIAQLVSRRGNACKSFSHSAGDVTSNRE